MSKDLNIRGYTSPADFIRTADTGEVIYFEVPEEHYRSMSARVAAIISKHRKVLPDDTFSIEKLTSTSVRNDKLVIQGVLMKITKDA